MSRIKTITRSAFGSGLARRWRLATRTQIGALIVLCSVGAATGATPGAPAHTGLKYPFDAQATGKVKKPGPKISSYVGTPTHVTPQQEAELDAVSETFGNGVNTFNNKQQINCVNGKIHGPVPLGRKTEFFIERISSSAELQSSLSAEASLEGDFASWSAKATAKYESEKQSNSMSEFVLVKSRVQLTPEITLHEAVAVEKPADSTAEAKIKFFQLCGDAYIDRVIMGGELMALLKYEAHDEQDRQAFAASFSAHGWGVSADASLTTEQKAKLHAMSVELNVFMQGGSGEPANAGADAVMDFGLKYPSSVSVENAAMVGFTTRSYQNVHLDVADLSDIKEKYTAVETALADREATYDRMTDFQNQLNQYSIGDVYGAQRAQLQAEIKATQTVMAACAKAPQQCNPPQNLQSYEKPVHLFTPLLGTLYSNNGNPVAWTVDEETHVTVTGHVCYNQEGFCADNGKMLDGNNYVEVNLNGNVKTYSGPFDIPKPPPGQPFILQIRVVDRGDYSDNSGAYTCVLY